MAKPAAKRQLRVDARAAQAARQAQAQADQQQIRLAKIDLQRFRAGQGTARVTARTVGVAQAKRDAIVGKFSAIAGGKVGVAEARSRATIGAAGVAADAAVEQTDILRSTGLSGLLNSAGDGVSSLFSSFGGESAGGDGAAAAVPPVLLIALALGVFLLLRR